MKSILFSGTANLPLAKKLAKKLNIKLGKIEIKKFSDGETYVNILERVKGKKVFILQSGNNPANENLMELLIIIDALKRLKPKKIVAVLPFYPYRRQERKTKFGEPITAELVAKLLEAAGVNKIITIDLHSPKIKNFFKIPILELTALPVFVEYFKKLPLSLNPSPAEGGGKKLKNFAVLAPDAGSIKKSQNLAKALKLPLVKFYKFRPDHNQVKIKKSKGRISGKNVIIIDDEVNTAGTIVAAVKNLEKYQVKNIYLAFTHPVLSGPAIQRLKNLPIKEIIITDTINIPKEKRLKKIRILSVAGILANSLK